MTSKNENTNKAPVAKVRVGLMTASIWENKGENAVFYNVSFERRYRDSEGNWRSSHSYNADDLLVLAKVADLAPHKNPGPSERRRIGAGPANSGRPFKGLPASMLLVVSTGAPVYWFSGNRTFEAWR